LISKLAAGMLAPLAAWAILATVAVYRTHEARIEADDFSREFVKLQVQKSGIDVVTSLVRKYHGSWRDYATPSNSESPCGGNAEIADFIFDNTWLHRLFLAPLTEYSATIYVKSDCVCFRSLGIWDTVERFTGVHIQEFSEAPAMHSFYSRLMLPKAVIVMDTHAPAEARAAAFSLNLDCLTKLRGCQDTREMAPAIWKNSHRVGPTLWKSQWDE